MKYLLVVASLLMAHSAYAYEETCIRACSHSVAACNHSCNSNATCAPCNSAYYACTARCPPEVSPPSTNKGMVR
jgi:hypothetical protein